MERDYGGATSPPPSDGESYGLTAPKLSALFAMEHQKLQSGNSSFRYHPPKLLGVQSTAKGANPVVGSATNMPGQSGSYNAAPSLQVLHSVALSQLLISNSSGGKNVIDNAGMAILETTSSHTKSYQLVLYDASKRTLLNSPINQVFQCTPKANSWVNFLTVNQTWSALFNSTEDWMDFARALVLARSVVARVSHSFSGVIIQDVSPQQDMVQAGLCEGDMVQVTYKAWIERPGFPGTLGPCFQETAGKGKKLELGSGKAIKGLEQGVIGMTKNSRRLLIVPPHLAHGSATKRPDRIPDDAVLFFDITVSRTRRHKGPASEALYDGRELLSDQLSYNDDAGSDREELTASDSRSIHGELKIASAQTVSKEDTEENAEGGNYLANEKEELLIDRMAKLSRIGGAGSYNLPPSSVVAHHRRSSIETSQPSSPSSVVTTPKKCPADPSQLSLDGVDRSRDPSNGLAAVVGHPGVNDTLKSTSIGKALIENKDEQTWKRMEENEPSESENHLPERRDVDDELQLASSLTFTQHVGDQHAELGDAVVDMPLLANENAGKMENLLNRTTSEVTGHSTISNSSRAQQLTVNPSSNADAVGLQSAGITMPGPSPALAAQWAPSSTFAYPPFAFPTATCTVPSNSSEVSPSYSLVNQAVQLQPMGPLTYAATPLPGQSTQPFLTHTAVVPWFPWGFPQYAPQPYSVPTAESKDETEQLKILRSIQQVQESFAESLRSLTIKVEALTQVLHKRSGSLENEQSSSRLGSGCTRSISLDQVSSEDGDNQVDSLVESVALMLAENRELRRRLLENKLQSPAGMGPSTEQFSRRVMSNTGDEKWLEDPGSSLEIPQLDLAQKTQTHVEFEPTAVSTRVFSSGGDELTMAVEHEMKLVMDQVCREVAEG